MFFTWKAPAFFLLSILFVAGCTTTDKHIPVADEQPVSGIQEINPPETVEDTSVTVTNEMNNNIPDEKQDHQDTPETVAENQTLNPEKAIEETPTDQEMIDSALEYCQASNDFWELGYL